MSIQLLCAKMVPLTRGLIERFTTGLTVLDADRQRFSRKRVEYFESERKQGFLRPPEWCEVHCMATGKDYRGNGQHTARSFLEFLDGHIPPEMKVQLIKYRVDALGEVATVYSKFDLKLSSRTEGELSVAHGVAAGLSDLRKGYLEKINGGVAFAYRLGGDRNLRKDDRPMLIREYPAFYSWMPEFCKRSWLLYPSVVAAMFMIYPKASRAASDFWRMVRDQDAAKDHVTNVLAEFLRENKPGKHPNGPTAGGKMFYAKCIKAWNAYRNQDTSSRAMAYYRAAPIPTPV